MKRFLSHFRFWCGPSSIPNPGSVPRIDAIVTIVLGRDNTRLIVYARIAETKEQDSYAKKFDSVSPLGRQQRQHKGLKATHHHVDVDEEDDPSDAYSKVGTF